MILMLNGKNPFLRPDLLTIQYTSDLCTIKCEFLETKEANLFPKPRPILSPAPPPPAPAAWQASGTRQLSLFRQILIVN